MKYTVYFLTLLIALFLCIQCGGGDEGTAATTGQQASDDGDPLVNENADESKEDSSGASGPQYMRHNDCVYGMDFSDDGNRLASCSRDGVIKIWLVRTGQMVHQVFTSVTAFYVDFNPDGTKLAVASEDGKVRIINADSGEQIKELSDHSESIFVAKFSKDGSMLATGGDDDTIILWNTSDWTVKHILTGHTDRITDLAFNSDGSRLGSSTRFDHLRIWDTSSGREIPVSFDYDNMVALCMDFHPTENKIVTGGIDEVLRLWDIGSGTQLQLFEGHAHEISGVRFTPRGNIISASKDGNLLGWKEDSSEPVVRYSGNDEAIYSLSISNDFVAGGTMDGRIILWKAKEGTIFVPSGS